MVLNYKKSGRYFNTPRFYYLTTPIALRTALRRSSGLKGFRTHGTPSSSASCSVSLSSAAVRNITGIVIPTPRMRFRVSNPLSPGIITSRSTRSAPSESLLSHSSPEAAFTVSYPFFVSMNSVILRFIGSSSVMIIFAMSCPFVTCTFYILYHHISLLSMSRKPTTIISKT